MEGFSLSFAQFYLLNELLFSLSQLTLEPLSLTTLSNDARRHIYIGGHEINQLRMKISGQFLKN